MNREIIHSPTHRSWCEILRLSVLIGLVAFSAPGVAQLPGDVAPRSSTDGQLNAGDAVVLQRIVNGLVTPTFFEQLSGDIAPLGAPDSLLDAADVLLLMRAINGDVVLPDNLAPVPADVSLITVTDTGTGTVDLDGAAGSVEGGSLVEVVNYQTGVTASVTANSDGSFFISLAAVTSEVIGVTVTDTASNTGPQTQVGVGQLLTTSITSPADGAVIADDRVMDCIYVSDVVLLLASREHRGRQITSTGRALTIRPVQLPDCMAMHIRLL